MNTSPHANKLRAWIMTITAGLLFFYEFIQLNSINTLNRSLIATFHFSNQQLGIISSAYFIANASLVFIAGNILDRNSARRCVLIATVLCTLGTIGFGMADSFWQLTIARFIIGIGGAFCFLSGLKIATRWFPLTEIGLATGVLVTMAMLGGMVAQSPLQYLINNFGWRHALYINAALGLIILCIMFIILCDTPEHRVLKQKNINNLNSILPSILLATKNYKNYLAAIYTCCLNLPIFILGAIWGVSYLHACGINEIMAAHICLMLFIGSMAGCPVVGILTDRIGHHREVMLLAGACCMILFIMLISNKMHNHWDIMAIFFALGFISSAQIVSYSYVNINNCKSIGASATSIISTILLLGGAVMQPLFGQVLDHATHSNLTIQNAYRIAMLLLPLSIVVAMIAAYFLPKNTAKAIVDN
jgi:MFS family permease